MLAEYAWVDRMSLEESERWVGALACEDYALILSRADTDTASTSTAMAGARGGERSCRRIASC